MSTHAVQRLYFDNAATSFPKPPAVLEAMTDYATRIGASAGRGAYSEAVESGRVLQRTREMICRLINGASAQHVVFTLNCSDALNLAIKGLVTHQSPGHVICTATDHNSILRPLTALSEQGVASVTHAPVSSVGIVDVDAIRHAIRPDTHAIAITHVSNVTGAIQPLREIGRIAREHAIPLIVDAAQSIGHLPIDVDLDCVDLLAAPGHKGLMGPLGTGFLYIRPGMEKLLRPLREGGTGSQSDLPRQPDDMPDKYEPGSHNAIGLAGLCAGVEWVLDRGIDSIARHERELVCNFLEGFEYAPGLTYFGPQGVKDRIGVFSVRVGGYEPLELGAALEHEFGVLSRSGIHCAPLIHDRLGTLHRGGTTRLSTGPFLTIADVTYACDALADLAGRKHFTHA